MGDRQILDGINELRTMCNESLRKPTVSSFNLLRQYVESCSDGAIQSAGSYLILPIMTILKKELPNINLGQWDIESQEHLLLEYLKVLEVVLRKANIPNDKHFEELLAVLTDLLDPDSPNGTIAYAKVNQPWGITTTVLLSCIQHISPYYNPRRDRHEHCRPYYLQICYTIHLLKVIIDKHDDYMHPAVLAIESILLNIVGPGVVPTDTQHLGFHLNVDQIHPDEINLIVSIMPSIISTVYKMFVESPDLLLKWPDLYYRLIRLTSFIISIVYHKDRNFTDKVTFFDGDPKSGGLVEIEGQTFWKNNERNLTIILRCLIGHLSRRKFYDLCMYFSASLLANCCPDFVKHYLVVLMTGIVINSQMAKLESHDIFYANFLCRIQPSFHQIGGRSSQHSDNFGHELFDCIADDLMRYVQALPFRLRMLQAQSETLIAEKDHCVHNLDPRESLLAIKNYINLLKPDHMQAFMLIDPYCRQLWRTLIGASEFDFHCPKATASVEVGMLFEHRFSSYELNLLLDRTDRIDERSLFGRLDFRTSMRFFADDSELFDLYIELMEAVAVNVRPADNEVSAYHLIELLHQSNFDLSVLLVTTLWITSKPQSAAGESKAIYEQFLPILLGRLNISSVHQAREAEDKPQAANKLNSMKFEAMLHILEPVDSMQINSSKSQKRAELTQEILRQSLLLYVVVVCYVRLAVVDVYRRDRIVNDLCMHLLEAYACEWTALSEMGEYGLIFMEQQIGKKKPDHDSNPPNHLKLVRNFLLHNIGLLNARMESMLGLDLIYRGDAFSHARLDTQTFSIRTVESTSRVLLRLFEHFIEVFEPIKVSLMVDYTGRWVELVLNILDYYASAPTATSERQAKGDKVCRLLVVIESYLKFMMIAFKNKMTTTTTSMTSRTKRLGRGQALEVKELVAKLAEYAAHLEEVYKPLEEFDDKTEPKNILEEIEKEEDKMSIEEDDERLKEEEQKQAILRSPIVNSPVGRIMFTCSRLMDDQNIEVRLKTLPLITMGLKLLGNYEDLLLPYVHNIWEPLMVRFTKDYEHAPMVYRAYECLLLVAQLAGDFVRSRTIGQVMPKLVGFLQRVCTDRSLYYRRHGKMQTSGHYADAEVVSTAGRLVVDTRLEDRQLWQLVECLLTYLHSPGICGELREAAFQSLLTIATEADSMIVLHYINLSLEEGSDPTGQIEQLRQIVNQL